MQHSFIRSSSIAVALFAAVATLNLFASTDASAEPETKKETVQLAARGAEGGIRKDTDGGIRKDTDGGIRKGTEGGIRKDTLLAGCPSCGKGKKDESGLLLSTEAEAQEKDKPTSVSLFA